MEILQEIDLTAKRMREYLETSWYWKTPILPKHLDDAVHSYLQAEGKYLRPCILLWSCRALGGDEAKALPAALAVELFHTWTLVHDDVIDRATLRRGRPTVNQEFSRRAGEDLQIPEEFQEHYGQSVAILAGDLQHGWAVRAMADLAGESPTQELAQLALGLIREMERFVLTRLIEGQILDVQLSRQALSKVTEYEIVRMIAGKTAALFSFCARAGGLLAKGAYLPRDLQVSALGEYGYHAGIAFQLQDDIMGVSGDEAKMGKSALSDIREGKRTVPLQYCWAHVDASARKRLEKIVGQPDASPEQVREVCALIAEAGGIEYARQLAQKHLDLAMTSLEAVEPGTERELLEGLAHFMAERSR